MKDILHLKAPGNWINDPNGFIWYGGQYHLFYQYFPFAPRWGTMHWGHAVSPDLVHWQHCGTALFPTKQYDRNGVFSGTALEVDGSLYLYYTAMRYLQEDPDDIHHALYQGAEASQAMLISPDGRTFDNWGAKRQIIPPLTDPQIGDVLDTRDPKVWCSDGMYYMVIGSTDGHRTGKTLFFRSRDAVHWEYANQCASPQFGWMLECPDLFMLGDQYVFIGSPIIGRSEQGYNGRAMCGRASFDAQTCALQLQETLYSVDYGVDFYAPQTTLDADGRRVVVGWMRMPQAVEDAQRGAWNGMMSLPRVVELHDGAIWFCVHPAVDAAFSRPVAVRDTLDLRAPVRLKTTLGEGESLDIGGYRITVRGGCVTADRSAVFARHAECDLTACTPQCPGERCSLDIFVDRNLIEIFVDGGRYVLSHVVYGLGDTLRGKVDAMFTM